MDSALEIVSMGAASSVGASAAATVVAAHAGVANFREHPFMVDLGGEPYVLARAPYLADDLQGEQRGVSLLELALEECAGCVQAPLVRVYAALCLSQAGSGPDAEDAYTGWLGAQSHVRLTEVDTVAEGHAAMYPALQGASERLQADACEFALLIGVESAVDAALLNQLELTEGVLSATNPYGAIPGEAAACVLLCTPQTRQRYGLRSLGRVSSVASAEEPVHHTQGVCLGLGLTDAMRGALEHASLDGTIAHTICDLNGQPHRADEFGFASARLSEWFQAPDRFVAPADCWGDVGAAAGVLGLILATSYADMDFGNILLWGSSPRALRGAAVYQAPQRSST